MRARLWCTLLGLGLAGCGVSTSAEETQAVDTGRSEARAQACPQGTASRLKVITPPGSGPVLIAGKQRGTDLLVDMGGSLYFGTNFQDGSAALWRTDGTPGGTVEVNRFAPTPRRAPRLGGMVAMGSKVFFEVDDPVTGNELWVSDGTQAGSRLLKDMTPGAEGSSLMHHTALEDVLVFVRGTFDTRPPYVHHELWRSDGTPEGTFRVALVSDDVTVQASSLKVGNALLLFLSSERGGTTLWRTDGTPAGTFAVKKVDSRDAYVHHVDPTGDVGLFVMNDGSHDEVWKTDGTAQGTVRLDSFGRSTRLLGVLGSWVYLGTLSSNLRSLHVERLSLEGGGKARIATLDNPYSNRPDAMPYLQRAQRSEGKLYFTMAIGGTGPGHQDVSLWVTDGSAAGTRFIHRPLDLSLDSSSPLFDTGHGALLFSGSEYGATEPWFTRGTSATTGQLEDISPGPWGSSPAGFRRLGEHVFFFAKDDTGDLQLWSTLADFSCSAGATP
ncbi:ELWxxDGT repeat-containing protein [Myxococcus fulvus]|uniref:ELWxxDGT repeat-containing protein n=1 Tax=Myxococcus fulvus TaxID=33 RepID=A0A511TFK5_MYXFU|nr:hypothetical protein MFU01_79960 [Myxococcus fulvus]SEU38467.1 ELWxxDGT repeat-containing protein [Myxococcus fulvus]